jgi:hypothetical protein
MAVLENIRGMEMVSKFRADDVLAALAVDVGHSPTYAFPRRFHSP